MPALTRCRASAHARSGRPTIDEGRQAVLDVSLHLDAPRLEADERMRDCACKHAADATRRVCTRLSSLLHDLE